MSLADGVRLALRALAANKLRTSLTVLGMVIGVAAVIALMSLGAGAQASIESNIRGTGSNLLFISPGFQAQTGGRFVDVSATTPTLTLDDAEAIRDAAIPGIVDVAPTRSTGASLVAEGNAFSTQIIGATPSYAEVRSFQPQAGRFITDDDLNRRARVIALGQSLAIDLFPGQNPIGATLRLNNQTFTVIAVMEESGQATFQSRDNQALVPLTTLQTRISPSRTLTGDDIVTEISVTLADEDESTIEAVTAELSALLRLRHDVLEDDFTIRTQQDIIEALGEVTGTLTLVSGRHRGHFAAGRRHRNHEHHAGLGHRANARDRHPQGHRRAPPRHLDAVPHRGRPGQSGRRHRGGRHRRPAGDVHGRRELWWPRAGGPAHTRAGDPGVGRIRGHRLGVRHLPRQPRGASAANRSVALRVSG